MSDDLPKNLRWKFTIKPEADVLALAAFLLSVVGIACSVWSFVRGAHVTMFPPEQVLIIRDKDSNSPRFSTSMSYVNDGQPGYNAVITSEALCFDCNGRSYEHKWQEFVTFTTFEGALTAHDAVDAAPFAVNGGSETSHSTYFAARTTREDPGRNYLSWDTFIGGIQRNRKLTIRFTSQLLGKKPVSCTAVVDISDYLISRLKDKGYSAPSCWPVKERSWWPWASAATSFPILQPLRYQKSISVPYQ